MNLKDILKKLRLFIRHLKFSNKTIKQNNVTVFCNCCIAGQMYNDLKMKFLSPTINLFFGHHGFIDFVNHYEEYADAQLVETGRYDAGGGSAPVCLLKKDGLPDVEIHFLHYDSFEQAKEKWYDRYKRINKSKIYLVIEAQDAHEHSLIDEYSNLPYPKIIFTDLPTDLEKRVLHMNFYDKFGRKKSVTSFYGFFGKRGYDEFNFVDEIFNYEY